MLRVLKLAIILVSRLAMIIFGISSLLFVVLYFDILNYFRFAHMAVIPEKLKYEKVLETGSQQGFRESCGATVFQLEKSVVSEIVKQDLSFFDEVTTAEKPKERSHYGRYESWQKTPIGKGSAGEGFVALTTSCASISKRLQRILIKEGHGDKGYFTISPESMLLVLPEYQLMLYMHYG